jgi:ribosomal biogenesis protein LAS1
MRQVPWESWQQWHHTRRCLFSSDSALVAKALDRITAWQCRGRVPVAVEITGELISIHQRDPQFTAGLPETAAILPGEMLRMMYAMAIMRLVNGVVDQSQKRNTTSVALRAEAAELPRVLVDIRHGAHLDHHLYYCLNCCLLCRYLSPVLSSVGARLLKATTKS